MPLPSIDGHALALAALAGGAVLLVPPLVGFVRKLLTRRPEAVEPPEPKRTDRTASGLLLNAEKYRRTWPRWMAQPSDRDLVAAVITTAAHRRRIYPSMPGGEDAAWCNAEDVPLGTYLETVSHTDAWQELDTERRKQDLAHAGEHPAGLPKLASFAQALPRLRGLGELILAERAEPELLPEAEAEAGGRKTKAKAKSKAKAKPQQAEEEAEELTPEELEEIERMRLTPRM